MLSRLTLLLRVVAVGTVLTMAAVAGAKMRHVKPDRSDEPQPASGLAQADAAAEAQPGLIGGHAMYPLGVPTGLAAHHEGKAATQILASDHLRDLGELRTSSRSGAPLWGNSNWHRGGGGSSAFGHGFASAGASFGGIGFGGGRTPKPATTAQTTPASVTGAPKSPASGKTPSTSVPAPRAPSAAPTPPAPAPAVITAPPVVAVAPPIFANETTPIPVLTGTTASAVDPPPGSFGGATSGSAPVGGAPLSPTPEPASLLLIATGLAGVVGVSRRRHPKP